MKYLKTVLTAPVNFRLLVGWGAFFVVYFNRDKLTAYTSSWALLVTFVVNTLVITVCAFGVVTQADHLAKRLGEPYGTLILTLSIVSIEVILIAAVLLGPGDHPEIARDSVMAVTMIIMNLVIGIALLIGGNKHPKKQLNRAGLSNYLSLSVVMVLFAFGLPTLIGDGQGYSSGQALLIAILTLGCYGFFLYRQTGAQRMDFTEHTVGQPNRETQHRNALTTVTAVRGEVLTRSIVLIVLVLPIVLLSHDLAGTLDIGLNRLQAPAALSGLLIAMIVFLPETITTFRAAAAGQMQRVSNLTHGAVVSTYGMTIPVVLLIGLFMQQQVVLAESATNLVLLATTLVLTAVSFSQRRSGQIQGLAHLALFVGYSMTIIT